MLEAAPDDEEERIAWRRRALARLVNIGMEIAEALKQRVASEEALAFDPGLAFGRLARAVRLSLVLDEKMGATAAERAAQAERRRLQKARDEQTARMYRRKDEAYGRIERAVSAEAAQAEARGEYFDAEGLLAEAFERLDDDEADAFDWMGDEPIREIAERVCRDLGVPFEPEGWREGQAAASALEADEDEAAAPRPACDPAFAAGRAVPAPAATGPP